MTTFLLLSVEPDKTSTRSQTDSYISCVVLQMRISGELSRCDKRIVCVKKSARSASGELPMGLLKPLISSNTLMICEPYISLEIRMSRCAASTGDSRSSASTRRMYIKCDDTLLGLKHILRMVSRRNRAWSDVK